MIPQEVYYYHCNPAVLPEDVTDSAGHIIWRGRYTIWGKLVYEHNTCYTPAGFSQPLRMQGQYDDGNTGLYYNTYRYYDAEVGRYTCEDPIGLNGGINLYKYVNNPIAWTDPLGLVDLNLFPRNENIYDFAENVPPQRGVFTVGVHGDAQGVYDQNGDLIKVNDLAQMIRATAGNRGLNRIELLSCSVAQGDYPQRLANALQIEVRAATELTWISQDGTHFTAPRDPANPVQPDPVNRGRSVRFYDPRQPR